MDLAARDRLTLVSQFLDSFVVLWIAFGLNPNTGWDLGRIFSIGLVNYAYKFTMAIVLTSAIYLVHGAIERYLGPSLAEQMRRSAMGDQAPI